MIHADGEVNDNEISLIQRLASNTEIRKKDHDRILDAINQCQDIDYVCNNYLMYEKKREKAEIKARLLLSIAWEIAKSDNKIHQKEIEMHDQMARIFNMEAHYTEEIRMILSPELSHA